LNQGLKRATHLVSQLLTLARQEPGTAERPLASVRLAPLAQQVVAEHVVLAETKSIDLGISQADETAVINGDAEGLRILFGNLVDNAMRYTPAGGRVDVTIGVEDQRPFLEVADSGPGIPAADRYRVFDRFYRREGAAASGSGLGLAIVKNVADRHRASVRLGDRPEGGLVVRVEFPPR
jgi:two-component system OmpR family sensor kinase